jgi:uncharacterized protein (UPF0147 family)
MKANVQLPPAIRKVCSVLDPEAKVRVIAILDYFSQDALFPLHKQIMKVLEGIPQDRTFQQNAKSFVGKSRSSFHSIDLTNATDRFPVEFQSIVLEEMFGAEFARA